MAGSDSNWGRIIMAIGKSGVKVDSENISIKFGENFIVKNGEIFKKINFKKINNYLKKSHVNLYVKVGLEKIHQQFGHVILLMNIFLLMRIQELMIIKVVACILHRRNKVLISSRPPQKELAGFL